MSCCTIRFVFCGLEGRVLRTYVFTVVASFRNVPALGLLKAQTD